MSTQSTVSDAQETVKIPSKSTLVGFPDGVAWPINYEEIYNLKGRILTLIDATYVDPVQREAAKDIFWTAIKGWANDIAGSRGDPGYRP